MAYSIHSAVWSVINPYKIENVSNLAPDEDGVYVLCTKQENGEYRVRYVGQGNIKDRLIYHLSDNEQNKELKEHIAKYKMKACYASVCKQKDRDDIERFLYDTYEPRYNKIRPPSNTPLKVNLPPV